MRPPPAPAGPTTEEKAAVREQLKALGWRGPALNKELTRLLGKLLAHFFLFFEYSLFLF